jgi:hypothetical protein
MTLQEFNKNYRYKSDITNYGREEHWVVIEPAEDGLYYGDCEDYVLTIKKLVPEYANLKLVYCKISDVGHCIGETPNGKFIDCIVQREATKEELIKMGYGSFMRFWDIMVWMKMLQAKVQRLLGLKTKPFGSY